MKTFFLVLFATAICQAAPSVQFECIVWQPKGQDPSSFRIYDDYSKQKDYIQFGSLEDSKKNPATSVARSDFGPTVTYQNKKVRVYLANQGGPAGRWDGEIRFSDNGKFYNLKDRAYRAFCQIK